MGERFMIEVLKIPKIHHCQRLYIIHQKLEGIKFFLQLETSWIVQWFKQFSNYDRNAGEECFSEGYLHFLQFNHDHYDQNPSEFALKQKTLSRFEKLNAKNAPEGAQKFYVNVTQQTTRSQPNYMLSKMRDDFQINYTFNKRFLASYVNIPRDSE